MGKCCPAAAQGMLAMLRHVKLSQTIVCVCAYTIDCLPPAATEIRSGMENFCPYKLLSLTCTPPSVEITSGD